MGGQSPQQRGCYCRDRCVISAIPRLGISRHHLNEPALRLQPGLTPGTDKLNNALASIQAGLNKQAINQLNAFISSVQSSFKTGKMGAATAITLTAAAIAVL